MKSYLTYGALIAAGNGVVTLTLYLAGFHSDPGKLQAANLASFVTGLALGVSFLIVGLRAKRAALPPTQDFSYGTALSAGVLISLFAALLGTAFQYLYQSFINPGLADLLIQAQETQLQQRGVPAEQIEKALQVMRFFIKPSVQAFIGFMFSMVFSTLVALVTAAFLKRKATEKPFAPTTA